MNQPTTVLHDNLNTSKLTLLTQILYKHTVSSLKPHLHISRRGSSREISFEEPVKFCHIMEIMVLVIWKWCSWCLPDL